MAEGGYRGAKRERKGAERVQHQAQDMQQMWTKQRIQARGQKF